MTRRAESAPDPPASPSHRLPSATPLLRLPPVPLRRRIRDGIDGALYWSGAASLYARTRPGAGATILMYHCIPDVALEPWVDPRNAIPRSLFAQQLHFLARHRYVLPLGELVERLERGDPLEPGSVALTFDDGYRDNLQQALPLLVNYDLPATIYLATGAVNRREPQWIDRLYTAFRHRTRDSLELPGEGRTVALRDPQTLAGTYLALAGQLLEAGVETRRTWLAAIDAALRPGASPPPLTLSWDEVRELQHAHSGIEIGAHTRDHLDLTRLSLGAAREQILGSCEDVTRETGRPVHHFSFPYGRSNPALRDLVAGMPLASAVVTGPGARIEAGADRYALPRVEAPRSLTRLRARTLDGWPGIAGVLARRA